MELLRQFSRVSVCLFVGVCLFVRADLETNPYMQGKFLGGFLVFAGMHQILTAAVVCIH